jgi:hypothetical protein
MRIDTVSSEWLVGKNRGEAGTEEGLIGRLK